jgi:hypothetical protein
MSEHLRRFAREEGVLFVGKAQEKTPVFRTEKRRSPTTGLPYPWIVRSSAMVNHYCVYAVDRDFGPFFLKFCSYFPFNARLCIAFEALDNGILSCADPVRLQAICDGLSAAKIDALLRKWLRLLPHPFTGADRRAGYRYDLSILQAEFSQLPDGFRSADLRHNFAALSARHHEAITQGAATYQLRRLRLHGLIARVPKSFRYRVTDLGLRVALFFTRANNRLLRPNLAAALPGLRALTNPIKRAFDHIDAQLTASIGQARLAA